MIGAVNMYAFPYSMDRDDLAAASTRTHSGGSIGSGHIVHGRQREGPHTGAAISRLRSISACPCSFTRPGSGGLSP